MQHVLFLCTGNYYRSRFAEYWFRHLAAERGLVWTAESRGLALSAANIGPLSIFTKRECNRLGVEFDDRNPVALREEDLQAAALTIAVKETEHRPMMRQQFPQWESRIEYWEVHDLDRAEAEEALATLKERVEQLVFRLQESGD